MEGSPHSVPIKRKTLLGVVRLSWGGGVRAYRNCHRIFMNVWEYEWELNTARRRKLTMATNPVLDTPYCLTEALHRGGAADCVIVATVVVVWAGLHLKAGVGQNWPLFIKVTNRLLKRMIFSSSSRIQHLYFSDGSSIKFLMQQWYLGIKSNGALLGILLSLHWVLLGLPVHSYILKKMS